MSEQRQILQNCQIVEELSANDAFVSFQVVCPDTGPARLLLAQPHARLAVTNEAAFFERAAQLQQLDIEGISPLVEAGYFQERVACLLSLETGPSLQELLAREMTAGRALNLLRRIIAMLVPAHALNLGHGSLKPASILVFDHDRPRLIDFGLSHLFQLDFNSGVDPRFCSPEQVRGERAGTAADIYSLGCLLYLMLAGRPPYSGSNNFSIATMHLEGRFPELPESFSGCRELLTGMTCLSASQRFTAGQVADRLDALLEDSDLLAVTCGTTGGSPLEPFGEEPGEEDPELPSISSKVEALLRQQAHLAAEPEAEPSEVTPAVPAATGLGREKASAPRRYVSLLLLGVVIGMALFLGYSYVQDDPAAVSLDAREPVFPVHTLDDSLMAWHDLDLAVARGKLEDLLKDYPHDPRAYNNLAALYAAGGDLEQARKLLEQGLATNEQYLTMHRNLGAIYAELARKSYGKALQLDSSEQQLPLQVFSSQGIYLLKKAEEPAVAETVQDAAPAVPVETEKSPTAPAESAVEPSATSSSALAASNSAAERSTEDETGPAELQADEESAPAVQEVAGLPAMSDQEAASTLQAAKDERLEQATNVLANWARAWSTHDVEGYLSYYADDFEPAGGLARSEWEAQRRRRLTVPGDIEISLDEVKIIAEDENSLTLEVMQSYRSDRYRDVTRKQFQLSKPLGQAKILRENALEIMR